jgi:hypothetical protein
MIPSFHNADKPTHRRVMVVGLLFCIAFVVISFSLAFHCGRRLKAVTRWSRPTGSSAPRANRPRQTDQGKLTLGGSSLNGPAICCLAIGDRSQWQ